MVGSAGKRRKAAALSFILLSSSLGGFGLAFALVAPCLGKEPPVVAFVKFEQDDMAALERHCVKNDGQPLAGVMRIGLSDARIADAAIAATACGIGDKNGIVGHECYCSYSNP